MKNHKILILLFTLFLLLNTNILFSGEIIIDLNHDQLPKGDKNIGKIFIGEILNLRKSNNNDKKLDEKYKNTNYIGTDMLTFKNKSIDNILRNMINNVLDYSGYDVLGSKPDGSAPVMNIEIGKFDLWGYLGYGITVKINLVLLSNDQKTELIRKEVTAATSFGIWDSLTPLFNRFHIALNEAMIQSLIFIESDQFLKAYNNLEKIEIQEVIFQDKKLTKIPNDLLENLNYLDLSNNTITKISNLDDKKDLLSIRLRGNKINKIEGIDNNKLLKGINLRNNNLTQIENLNNQKELMFLDVGYNNITQISSLDNLNKLIYLNLNDNDNLESLEGIKNLQNLIILDISDCRKFVKTEFSFSDNFSNLKSLNISASDLKKIRGLDNLKSLCNLYLYGNFIKKIENLDSLTNLEVLDLSDNFINVIENLDNQKNLKELKIIGSYSATNPTNEGIKKIENLDSLVNLEYLNLNYNRIKKIENLNNLKKLKRLCLAGNKLEKIENLEYLDNLQYILFVDGLTNKFAYSKPPKKITKESYDFLKNNEVIIDEKFNIDEYMTEYKIKIEEEK